MSFEQLVEKSKKVIEVDGEQLLFNWPTKKQADKVRKEYGKIVDRANSEETSEILQVFSDIESLVIRLLVEYHVSATTEDAVSQAIAATGGVNKSPLASGILGMFGLQMTADEEVSADEDATFPPVEGV